MKLSAVIYTVWCRTWLVMRFVMVTIKCWSVVVLMTAVWPMFVLKMMGRAFQKTSESVFLKPLHVWMIVGLEHRVAMV
ncbi:hypothetical protein D3C71_1643770 [compost metagenome]